MKYCYDMAMTVPYIHSVEAWAVWYCRSFLCFLPPHLLLKISNKKINTPLRSHSYYLVLCIQINSAANSHGCVAIVRHLKLEDKIEIVNAYGKTRTPAFLAINPCHTCPTLELDGNDAIWESCAIMRYLCLNNDGGEELYPADPVLRGKIDMVME